MPNLAFFSCCRAARWCVALMVVLGVGVAAGRPLQDAPPLPIPDAGRVTVRNADQLAAAVRNAQSGAVIVLLPGKYVLKQTLHFRGPAQDVMLVGATGNANDVQLIGPGMNAQNHPAIKHGILVGNVQGITIANLTIRDMPFHAIALQGSDGCQRPRIYNCRLLDTGQQQVKANPGPNGEGVHDGQVQFTAIGYSTTPRDWYTNGVDVHSGKRWVIEHCFFRNFRAPPGESRLAGPAVLMWNKSADTIVDSCLFYDCDTAIAFGRGQGEAPEHIGGVIRNNYIFRQKGRRGDVGISLWNAPDCQVLHNTVILNGTHPAAIEMRFFPTRRVQVRGNLVDGRIDRRDNAGASLANNITAPLRSWFVDIDGGNLRLTDNAKQEVVDAVAPSEEVQYDYYGTARPIGARSDIGAEELPR